MGVAAARGLAAMMVLLSASGAAQAEDRDAARIDWARGLVIAGGVGVADRHAPSPAVARGTSRRGAEDAAKAALGVAIAALPLAAGGTAGARAHGALAAVVELEAEPETDGAWHVVMAVPIEAVRQAVAGRGRPVAAAGDKGAAVVVIDGVPAMAKPAVGWTVGGSAAATLWVTALPAWAKDAPHVRVTGATNGDLVAALPAGAGPGTLVLIVSGTR